MNKIALYVLAALVAITLLLFTCTYQVRFNEQAIVTTFGRAGDSAIQTEPGLHFKWPYPIQSVHNYDTRSRVLETRLENVMTSDQQLVVVEIFLTWKIEDLLRFFTSVETIERAERQLTDRLRSSLGVFSSFDFRDLLNTEPSQSKLIEVEQAMLESLEVSSGGNESVIELFGIDPQVVGVSRFILPQNTSTAVFSRMMKEREALAQDARSSGEAARTQIVSEAEWYASQIQNFADRLAAQIVAEGEQEAMRLLEQQAQSPEAEEFAIFLRKLDAFVAAIGRNSTVVLPALPPFDLLLGAPSVQSPGQLVQPPTADRGDVRNDAEGEAEQEVSLLEGGE